MTQPTPATPTLSAEQRARLLAWLPQDWPNRACEGADQSLFFAPDDPALARKFRYTRARKICQRCPLQVLPCREWATWIRPQEHGMWGGWTPEDRRAARRARAAGDAVDVEGGQRGAA